MATKVKDYYDVTYLEELAAKISAVTSEFNEKIFFEIMLPYPTGFRRWDKVA